MVPYWRDIFMNVMQMFHVIIIVHLQKNITEQIILGTPCSFPVKALHFVIVEHSTCINENSYQFCFEINVYHREKEVK